MSGGGGPGGGGTRGGGGGGPRSGGQRSPDREPGGPDFFEHGVKEDPQPSQLFDPQQYRNQAVALSGGEEQQQPMPPAPAGQQPTNPQPAGPPAPPPGAGQSIQSPRRPVNAEALPELGVIVLSADNQADIQAVLQIIEFIQKIGAGAEIKIDLYPLQHADATSVSNTLSQLFGRVQATAGGNLITPTPTRQPTPTASPFLPAAAAQVAPPSSVVLIPIPRFNAILLAVATARYNDVIENIKRLDVENYAGKAVPFALKKASAQTIATFIQQFYAMRYGTETTAQNQIRVTFDTPTNTVFVQAAPADLKEIAELIDRLDSFVSSAVNDLRIIHLRNALADELTNTITQALSAGVLAPGATAAPGLVPTPGAPGLPVGPGALPGVARPATAATTAGSTPVTKTTSLRFFSGRPGPGGVVESGPLEDVHITSDIRSNSMIISAPTKTMELILRLVEQLDVVAAARSEINIFMLKKADATITANLLRTLFLGTAAAPTTGLPGGLAAPTAAAPGATAGGLARPVLTLPGVQPSEGATLIDLRISVDDRSNSIIVAGSPNDLAVIEAIIARLEDAQVQSRQNQVYRLRNAAAADVATALQTYVTNTLNVLSGAGQLSAYQDLVRAVVIVPEPISNTLLISATPRYFAELMQMIEQIDAMPPQVVIQTLVAEVTLNDDQEFGVEFGLQSPVLFNRSLASGVTVNSIPQVGGPGFSFPTFNGSVSPLPNSAAVSPGAVGFQGLGQLGVGRQSATQNVGGLVFSLSSNSFNLLIRALKTQGRLDVLSRPQVMTLDNQTAAVNIGQDFPVVTSATVTATGLVTPSIDRRNVGVLLRITPRITPEGRVLMRVFPEVSTVGATIAVATGVTSQAFNIQQVETTVVANDGETVILGGLIQQTDQKQENKIPCLGDLPYIGAAFRYRTQIRKKTELLFILTPHVCRTQAERDRVLTEEARKMDWIESDVAKIHGPGGLDVLLSPKPPSPQMTGQPGGPDGCAPAAPGAAPLPAIVPGVPATYPPVAPQIPYGPLLPMTNNGTLAVTPAGTPLPPPAAAVPPPSGMPLPAPAVLPPGPGAPANPVTPPPAAQQGGPALTPASYQVPGPQAQPPQPGVPANPPAPVPYPPPPPMPVRLGGQ
jgi:type II secretion system protein D